MQSDAKGNWHDSKGRFMDKPKRIPNDVAPPMPYQSARDDASSTPNVRISI